MNLNLKEKNNDGFSLFELVIVIAVLAILAVIGGPLFLKIINFARFEIAKNHLRESFTSCINEPNVSPTNPNIPGVTFQSSNCSSLMSATIDNSCTISMDMATGIRTGWTKSYDLCVTPNIANSKSNSSGAINVAVADSSNSEARVWNEANWSEEQGCIGGGPGSYMGQTQTNFAMKKEILNLSGGLRTEMERQALDCHPEATLMEYRDTHKRYPEINLARNLDFNEEKKTGQEICRNDLLQRINCPGSNEFDEKKLKTLAEKHRREHQQLEAELMRETEENIEKQFPEIAKARAERREILRERGLLIEKEDIGRTDKCRNYWGWYEPCSDSQEAKVHEERMKTDLKYQAEQQDLKKRIDLDTFGEYRGDQNTTDGYHRAQYKRSAGSSYDILNKYHLGVADLYKKHQEELDQIRNK